MQTKATPAHTAVLFLPEFGGALAMAIVFAAVFRTRFVPVVAIAGLILIAGGAAVLSGVDAGSNALVPVGAGLVGLGVGASVSPALFVAGFSLRSQEIQRVFALVELLRGVAAFLAAPIIIHFAKTIGTSPATGIRPAIWVCFAIALLGVLAASYLLLLGRVRLRPPDLEAWLEGDAPALDSPPVAPHARA